MIPQIALIAASTRPRIFRRTYERMTGHAGIARLYSEGRIARPWLYYCRRPDETLPDFIDRDLWDVTERPKARPFVNVMYQMLGRADPGRDFIFLEDDLAPCKNALERVISEEVPPWAAVMTFFDYRCEWTSPGVFPHPQGRDLWGSQALKFPARVMPQFKEWAATGAIQIREGTDAWAGQAAYKMGLTVAAYSPTIFQHLGMLSAYAPGREPPVAKNYPGEDYDAMVNGCEDPISTGPWETVTEDLYCKLHRKVHEPKDFGRCRSNRTG